MKNKYRKRTNRKLATKMPVVNPNSIKGENYESLFIRKSLTPARQGKTSYLRKEFFDRIQSIIHLYSNSELSVSSYVDAVLEHHFETYKQEIKVIHDKLYVAPYE